MAWVGPKRQSKSHGKGQKFAGGACAPEAQQLHAARRLRQPGDNVKQVMEDFGLLKSQLDKEPKVQQLIKELFNDIVFVAAQGNSISAIMKYVEGIAIDVVPGLEIPIGTPLVYELEADLKPFPNDFSSRLMAVPSVPL